jgi:phosphoribosylamine--glycine ligase
MCVAAQIWTSRTESPPLEKTDDGQHLGVIAGARVMVVGGGSARDHALVRALRSSPRVSFVLFVPGNSAVEHLEGVDSAPVATQDTPGLVELAQLEEIDLTVVGPNTPLIMGIVDAFVEAGLTIFGPDRAAARLEGSKVFSKNFMIRSSIPTARFAVFHDTERAKYFCRRTSWARVIKTDGLAYERGVAVCDDVAACELAIDRIMLDEVLDADQPARVVIEERLVGPEVTVAILADGVNTMILDTSRNYPRQLDGDTGPRTRGMGAVSPAASIDDALYEEIRTSIVEPTVAAIADMDRPLSGALFIDIIVERGRPYVLDYNVRFGDPATQVLVSRLQSDLFDLLFACATGRLAEHRAEIQLDPRPAVSIVVATAGYPTVRREVEAVHIDPELETDDRRLDVGGMRWTPDGLVTTGSRVATVTAVGDTVEEATRRAYEGAAMVHFEGAHFRGDIGTGRKPSKS